MSSSKETKILIPAILNSYRPRADKSFSVGLVLNEPNRDQKEIIDSLFQQAVYVLIKAGEISSDDHEIMAKLEPKKRYSKSQKLRFAISELRSRRGIETNSEEYYNVMMDFLIDIINKK